MLLCLCVYKTDFFLVLLIQGCWLGGFEKMFIQIFLAKEYKRFQDFNMSKHQCYGKVHWPSIDAMGPYPDLIAWREKF